MHKWALDLQVQTLEKQSSFYKLERVFFFAFEHSGGLSIWDAGPCRSTTQSQKSWEMGMEGPLINIQSLCVHRHTENATYLHKQVDSHVRANNKQTY